MAQGRISVQTVAQGRVAASYHGPGEDLCGPGEGSQGPGEGSYGPGKDLCWPGEGSYGQGRTMLLCHCGPGVRRG